MSQKMLPFVHALLGTSLIFAVHFAEQAATAPGQKLSVNAVRAIGFICVFGVLLILEYLFDALEEAASGPGSISGHWVERSIPAEQDGDERFAYITISDVENGFYHVNGDVFDKDGSYRGEFEGKGELRSDKHTLHYHFSGYEKMVHQNGSGNFEFLKKDGKKAITFFGTFSLAGSTELRNGEGQRVNTPEKKKSEAGTAEGDTSERDRRWDVIKKVFLTESRRPGPQEQRTGSA